jgi:hypothetical protein
MTYGSDGQVADEILQLLHHHGRLRQLLFNCLDDYQDRDPNFRDPNFNVAF